MSRVCPKCQRLVYSRTISQCDICNAPLPADPLAEDYVGPVQGPAFQASRVIDEYRTLSLPGRLAVALHCFEKYCRARGLRHTSIDAFLNHMWELPCIKSYPEWDGAGHEISRDLFAPLAPEISHLLTSNGVSEAEFLDLLQHTVGIIEGSAYAASDDAGSLQCLEKVLSITGSAGVVPPPARPFLISLFGDRHGWGTKLDATQRDAWRYRAYERIAPS